MTLPIRTFSADVGQKSTGNAGPDAIETDIDSIIKMFDPTALNGGIGTANVVDAAITTDKIADGAVTAVKVAADVATQAELEAHTGNTSNPHSVTTTQIGAETPAGAQAKVDTHAALTDNPHSVTATQVGALVSIDGVSNPGGNIDLVGGTGITIAADDTNNVITITATGEAVPGYHMHSDTDINLTDTNNHFTATTLDGALDELFTYVSDGKTLVAAAITDKGVETQGSDTFATMAGNIDSLVLGSGTAVEADVLAGKTFSNDSGTGKTGTMTNNGTYNITPGVNNVTIPAGYHSGAGVVYGDADLVAGNIKSGVNIFGVTGNVVPSNGVYVIFMNTITDDLLEKVPVSIGYNTGEAGNTLTKNYPVDSLPSRTYRMGVSPGANVELSLATDIPVDLTNYNKLVARWYASGINNYGMFLIAGTSRVDTYATYTARKRASYLSGCDVLDISALTGSYYLRIHLLGDNYATYNVQLYDLYLLD
jgi:hypothetical protein